MVTTKEIGLTPIENKYAKIGIIVFEERILINIRDDNGAVYLFKPISFKKHQETILEEEFNLTIDLAINKIILITELVS
jgi:hypothetical protein